MGSDRSNVFRHDFIDLTGDHESHSSITSTQIPKYNAKRSSTKPHAKNYLMPPCATQHHPITLSIQSTKPAILLDFLISAKFVWG
ncbi:uncharacterized protein G2W53_009557 [Senna tora]|uniref:Uncharacterized protein n=1 Tax=Senna tora TaxID=362788 RepID=A0A834WY97_9FABA|nr:uncharacterized protein G2W53_009557 [Senna tora]